MTFSSSVPITVKIRNGVYMDKPIAHHLVKDLRQWGAAAVTLHGRSREQRYTKYADWEYINKCTQAVPGFPVFGNGDILSYEHAEAHKRETGVSGLMIARGALIKPWIFTEIKESRHWDISSGERLDILKEFAHHGLEHWGSDFQGVERTRNFMLELLSFSYRYVPVGLLERMPPQMNDKPLPYFGRNDLETMMASPDSQDWVKLTEMVLGPAPPQFRFVPKHKANSYSTEAEPQG